MIVIEVDKIQYSNFVNASVTLRLDALSNTFAFEAASNNARPLPFRGGEACLVFADGEQVLSGHIEVVNAAYSGRSHSITMTGRDKTGDLLDSSLPAFSDIKATTLKALCERVLDELGLSIKVIDEAQPDPFNPAEDISSPDPAENAFSFLEKYARKRHVLLSSDFDGNLLIVESSGVETGGLIQNRKDDRNTANNVVQGQVSYDQTGRYNSYLAVAQLNATAGSLAGILEAQSVADSTGKPSIDRRIRAGRQLILISEAMTSSPNSFDRADWEKNMRAARGVVYSPELVGFTDQEENLWAINTLPQVDDEDAGINARKLINTVTFSSSIDTGNTSILALVDRAAYTLQQQEPVLEDTDDDFQAITPVTLDEDDE